MLAKLIAGLAMGVSLLPAIAAPSASFVGYWTFDPKESQNVGMMASMTIHTTIVQSPTELIVDDISEFNGEEDRQHTAYNLAGEPVTNKPIMGGSATTRSHWEGGKLVTEWGAKARLPAPQ